MFLNGFCGRVSLQTLRQRRQSATKKQLTHVSKRVPIAHGKRGLGRGWQKRLAKGWRRVGTGLAKGWQGLAKGWRLSLHSPIFQLLLTPV